MITSSSYASPFTVIVDAVTRIPTPYTSPLHDNNDGGNNEYLYVFNVISSAAIKINTNDTNAPVYFAIIDAESSADITKTTTSSSQSLNNNRSSFNNGDSFVCTGDNDFDLYFDTVFHALSSDYNDKDGYFFGCTGENYSDLYFDTVFNAVSSVYNDKNSDSFGCTSGTKIFYEIFNNISLYDNINDNSLGRTNKTLQNNDTTVMMFHYPLNIIDHGSVVYFYHLKVLLFNQQCVFLFENNNGECNLSPTDVTTPGVITIATSYV